MCVVFCIVPIDCGWRLAKRFNSIVDVSTDGAMARIHRLVSMAKRRRQASAKTRRRARRQKGREIGFDYLIDTAYAHAIPAMYPMHTYYIQVWCIIHVLYTRICVHIQLFLVLLNSSLYVHIETVLRQREVFREIFGIFRYISELSESVERVIRRRREHGNHRGRLIRFSRRNRWQYHLAFWPCWLWSFRIGFVNLIEAIS